MKKRYVDFNGGSARKSMIRTRHSIFLASPICGDGRERETMSFVRSRQKAASPVR